MERIFLRKIPEFFFLRPLLGQRIEEIEAKKMSQINDSAFEKRREIREGEGDAMIE